MTTDTTNGAEGRTRDGRRGRPRADLAAGDGRGGPGDGTATSGAAARLASRAAAASPGGLAGPVAGSDPPDGRGREVDGR